MGTRRSNWQRQAGVLGQAGVAWAFYMVLRGLPIDRASAIAGAVGRVLGPRIGPTKRAVANLQLAYPGIADAETRRIVTGMWDNAARVAVDYIQLAQLIADKDRIEIVGGDVLDRIRDSGRAALFFTAHLGSWEMVTLAARRHDLPLCSVHRTFNNPIIDAYARRLQGQSGVEMITKGATGARRLIEVLKAGGNAVLLVDQRMNDGIPVPFFGHEAMTAPALAKFGLRFNADLVPAWAERLDGARFRVTFEPPLALPQKNSAASQLALMTEVNRRIEAWIRARPEQWFWLHRRWGKNPKPLIADAAAQAPDNQARPYQPQTTKRSAP